MTYLCNQIQDWKEARDQVMILGDWNEDICSAAIALPIQQLGLAQAITLIHLTIPPNTHNCGQDPIDGIFIPAEWLLTIMGGYLAFEQGIPSDHWAVWMDIPMEVMGWNSSSPSGPLQA